MDHQDDNHYDLTSLTSSSSNLLISCTSAITVADATARPAFTMPLTAPPQQYVPQMSFASDMKRDEGSVEDAFDVEQQLASDTMSTAPIPHFYDNPHSSSIHPVVVVQPKELVRLPPLQLKSEALEYESDENEQARFAWRVVSTANKKRILLLAPLGPGSGNAATASRLAHGLCQSSEITVDCLSVDMPHTDSDSLLALIHRYDVVLALHVYRAGHLLTSIYQNNSDLPPLILIFAGTELHSCLLEWMPTIEQIVPKARGLSLVNAIRSSCSRSNVTLTGGQSTGHVHALMRTAFAYLNTSINEGMCLAILEAMALRLPVIARRNTGNISIVTHGKTGLLFETPEQAAQCLSQLAKDTALRETLIQQAADQVKKVHSPTAESREYRNLIFSLLE
ncbi:unnamed protein product [Rotaria sp. Silwood2]|nr:unnamed protein product [Rotaria sp. Silwood2]CAF4196426.1 unnamed protein product [Rotaria sp. Silwood2]CAF4245573.1 unnamed protein product [Rotaria sp. Silwood2]